MSDGPEAAATLLVVEDDGELRELLARLLGDEGHRVDTAPDGQAGLHQALTDVVRTVRGIGYRAGTL